MTEVSLPYPVPSNAGAGAVHLEALARETDAELDYLDVAWPAQLDRPTRIMVPSANVTGLVWGGWNYVPIDSVVSSSPAAAWTPSSPGNMIPSTAYAGWYHLNVQVTCTPSGTADANTIRMIRLSIFEYSGLSGRPRIEDFYSQDWEVGAAAPAANIQIDAVAWLAPTRAAFVYLWHTNTSSTLTATVSGTSWTATLIAPKAVP